MLRKNYTTPPKHLTQRLVRCKHACACRRPSANACAIWCSYNRSVRGTVFPTTEATRWRSIVRAQSGDDAVSAPALASAQDADVVCIRTPLTPNAILSYPDRTVLVLGDLPEGCRVEAGGDVVVVGRLGGQIEAGLLGARDSVVCAGELRAQSLSVAGVAAPPGFAANARGPQIISLSSSGVLSSRPAAETVAVEGAQAGTAVGALAGALALLVGVGLLIAPTTTLGSFVQAADETLLGSLLETFVYGFILLQGANLLSDGSELLLEIVNPGVIGGVLLPCLGALPDSLIVLVSGLGVSREVAAEQLQVGIGTLAGSSVALLSLAWGGSLLVGRCDLDERGRMRNRTLTRGWDLVGTGVSVDPDVSRGAGLMLLTSLLYGIVQVPAWLGDPSDPRLALVGCVSCLVACVAYCVYQVVSPELQSRRIDAARKKRLRMVAVRALAARSLQQQMGSLVTPQGDVNAQAVDSIFDEFDRDGSGCIDTSELQGLLAGLELAEAGTVAKMKDDLEYWFKEFDVDKDRRITRAEFTTALRRWVSEKLQVSHSGVTGTSELTVADSMDVLMADVPADQQTLPSDDDNDEENEEAGEGPVSARDIALVAGAKLLAGIALCAVFSDPLVEALGHLSAASGIPPFFVGFVLTPLASNASELVSSLRFAARKRRKNINLTFSQVYGAVTMNNTLVLGLFLLVVYVQQLEWVYGAEVTAIVASTALLGAVAVSRQSLPTAWAIPSLALYPASLALVHALNTTLGSQ